MTRVYLRLDPAFFEKKAIEQHYPAGAALALVGVFCLGESQPERGRFRNERFLKALLGEYGRWLPYLFKHADVVRLEDGRIYAPGWDEWQEGDWKVGERVKRIRARHTNGRASDESVGTVTDGTVATVTNESVGTESKDSMATESNGRPPARGGAVRGRTSGAGRGGTSPSIESFPPENLSRARRPAPSDKRR